MSVVNIYTFPLRHAFPSSKFFALSHYLRESNASSDSVNLFSKLFVWSHTFNVSNCRRRELDLITATIPAVTKIQRPMAVLIVLSGFKRKMQIVSDILYFFSGKKQSLSESSSNPRNFSLFEGTNVDFPVYQPDQSLKGF